MYNVHMKHKNHKRTVGIFFGGKSAEHEVSIQSARNVYEALDKNLFEPLLIGIDKTGRWHVAENLQQIEAGSSLTAVGQSSQSAVPSLTLLPGENGTLVEASSSSASANAQPAIDVAIPVLHGPLGEDGTIQGFFELAGIPYVGPGVLGSAVGMDKDVMKRLLRDAQLPIAKFLTITVEELNTIDPEAVVSSLGLPVFVKPANMGSSIGVLKVESQDGLMAALHDAFQFDTKVLIEEFIAGSEIECAILGTNADPKASVIGKIVPRAGDFYSYEAKYIDENGAVLEIPADIKPELSAKAQDIAKRTFKVLGCDGMSRVDMFLTPDGYIIVNEINTIPGFTKISMYPKLWEASGLSYTDLITQLIELAIERKEIRNNLKTDYSS